MAINNGRQNIKAIIYFIIACKYSIFGPAHIIRL